MARPSIFTKETAERICEETATTSKSLKKICEPDEMPSVRTVLSWLAQGEKTEPKEEFKEFVQMYTRAKEEQADFMAEEIIEIADDGSNDYMTITKGDISYNVEDKEVTSRSKLRVESRKWVAAKLKPRKYGDKIDHNVAGELSVKQITGMEVK